MSYEDLLNDIDEYEAIGDTEYSLSLKQFLNRVNEITCGKDRENCIKLQELLNSDYPQYQKVNLL